METKDALAALEQFARYNVRNGVSRESDWRQDGMHIAANVPLVKPHVKAQLDERMGLERAEVDGKKVPARPAWTSKTLNVVRLTDIVTLHRGIFYSRVKHHIKNFDRTTKLDKSNNNKEPTFVKWKGKTYVWNGHHRMQAARLLGKALPCIFYDLDSAASKKHFAAWKKAHGKRT